MYDRECMIDNPYYIHDEMTEEDCSVCRKLRKIERVSNVSQSTIADDYLFSNVPVIVTDAMEEWDALEKFDISFLAEVRSDCKQGIKSAYKPLVAHQARAYPSCSVMKQLGVFLLPPGWDASPSQGHPQH